MSKAKNLATFGDNVDSSGNITDLNVDSNTLVVDAANNRVGIGTSTPDAALHVKDATSGTGRGLYINTGSVGPNDDAHILLNSRANYGYEGGEIVISDRNANGTSTSKQFKISLYDSDQFYINGSAGRVGIGTNAPQTTLDVNGDLRVQGNFTQQLTDSTNLWTDINSGANAYAPMGNELVIQNDALDVTNSMASIFFKPGQTTSGLQINSARIAAVREAGFDTSLAFSTRATSVGHTEKMRITSDGNVGIGTSSPRSKLDLSGGSITGVGNISSNSNSDAYTISGGGDVGNGGYVQLWGSSSPNPDLVLFGNSSTERMRINQAGNVGIGLTTPGTILDVNGTTTLRGAVYCNRTSALADAGGNNFSLSNTGAIGTTAHVIAGQGSGAVGLSINDGYGNANLTFNHHLGTPDVTGNSLRIETNVDSTTAANMTFEGKSTTTAGTATALNFMAVMYADTGNMTIGGSLTQNSDLRIKKDLQIIPDALDKVKTLNGYTYTRTDRDSEFQQTGCVAQEVQAVLPEAVTVGEDEQQTLSIAYGSMVGLLVEAIKELEAKVAALESGA